MNVTFYLFTRLVWHSYYLMGTNLVYPVSNAQFHLCIEASITFPIPFQVKLFSLEKRYDSFDPQIMTITIKSQFVRKSTICTRYNPEAAMDKILGIFLLALF